MLPWYNQPKLCISVPCFRLQRQQKALSPSQLSITAPPLCQRCGFHFCFPSRSLGPAMLTVLSALCLLSHRGYLATCSRHLPSTCQGMAQGTQHYAKASVCAVPLGLRQASPLYFSFLTQVSVNLFTFCSTAGWTA